MKIRQKSFPQASDGEHVAVIGDVTDLPGQKTRYGERDQIRVTFLTSEKVDGEPVRISLLCSASLHPDSKLRQLLDALGVRPGSELDTDQLIKRGCRLTTERRTVGEKVYANVTAMAPLRKNDKLPLVPLNFQRAEARPQQTKTNGKPAVPVPPVVPKEEGELFA